MVDIKEYLRQERSILDVSKKTAPKDRTNTGRFTSHLSKKPPFRKLACSMKGKIFTIKQVHGKAVGTGKSVFHQIRRKHVGRPEKKTCIIDGMHKEGFNKMMEL